MSALKNLTTSLLHFASSTLTRKGARKFIDASYDVESVQRSILSDTLNMVVGAESAVKHSLRKDMTVEEFRQQVPITDYNYWHDMIVEQQKSGKPMLTTSSCDRYQPTSGSTSKIKWIPYTRPFLDQADEAISPWMSDLYANFPGIKKGRHYWSLSWVPSDLRDQVSESINDDMQLLPWWKRLFMAGTMAVPEGVSLAESSDESFFATSCYLVACTDLSFMSVWSPTFAMSLLQVMQEHREKIAEVLETGQWVAPFDSLKNIEPPKNEAAAAYMRKWDGEITPAFTKAIWPNLALISSWDTSSSKGWAEKLQAIFPHSGFQGKGLFATEGVVTFPMGDEYPLAFTSHFYEFEDLDTNEILCSWELKKDMRVRPIITTGNGLLRYQTKDMLLVTDFINQCPCLRFISRIDGVDMVGEKLSPDAAVKLIDHFSGNMGLSPVTLIAIPQSDLRAKPVYGLLCSGSADAIAARDDLGAQLEEQLNQHFHYKLARELGQLGHAEMLIVPDAMEVYTEHKIAGGMVAGNIKIEPLALWQNDQMPGAVSDILRNSKPAEADA